MRKIALMVPLLALGAVQPEQPSRPIAPLQSRLVSPAPNCPTVKIAQSDGSHTVHKLGELPPGKAYQAVFRLGADGCIDPLLVSDRIRNTRER